MDKIIVLGTGNASPTKIFNTCFLLVNNNEDYILVDAGSGGCVYCQLELTNVKLKDIHNLIVSHKHADHIFGVIWIIRSITLMIKENKYDKELNIYCNDEVAASIMQIAKATLRSIQLSEIGSRVKINIVDDKQEINILDYNITFFNINGNSDKQFGFYTTLNNNKKLIFAGDEPLREDRVNIDFSNCNYLLHEAFCLDSEADIFKPYERDHATVKSAAITAEALNIKNLILWHTEDKDIKNRKARYTEEAKRYYSGNVFIPDDLEIIELN